MDSTTTNPEKEVIQDPQQQQETEETTAETGANTDVVQEGVDVQARGRPQMGGQRQKGASAKGTNREKEVGNKKKRKRYPPLPAEFHEVKTVDILINPLEPQIRLHPRKFLQLEPLERDEIGHAGGIDSNALVDGFYSESYIRKVQEFVMERKELLGVSPTDMSSRMMRRAIYEYYTQPYRGETAILQLVVAEYRLTRHVHGGRPRLSYCFKCRLQLEIGYLSRPWVMTKPPRERMLWFNESDLDSIEDAEEKERLCKAREDGWT